MDALTFVKKFGWAKTKKIVEENPEWSVKSNGYIYGTKFMDSGVYISELQHLVNSWELIESFKCKRYSGLSNAKDHALSLAHIEEYEKMRCLQKAITDVENVEIQKI